MAAVAGGRITAGVGANLIGQHAADRNQDATVYVGGLDPQVLPTASSVTPLWLLGPVWVRQCFIASFPVSAFLLQMSEELVWELFVQAGPVGNHPRALITASPVLFMCAPSVMYASAVNVYLPKDRVTNMHQQYGFVEYRGEEDADYVSCSVCNLICTRL